MDTTLLQRLGESDPIAAHWLPQIEHDGIRIYAPDVALYPEVAILSHLPQDRLQGLRIVLAAQSPIAVPELITGWYHQLFRVVWVRTGDRARAEIQRSLLHESGHHLWGTLNQHEQRHFSYSTRKCRGGPNDWRNPEERFADAIALAVTGALTRHDCKVTHYATEVLYARYC